MTLIDGDRIITAQLYDDEHEEFTEKKMSIIDYVNAYTDEGVTEAEPCEDEEVIRLPRGALKAGIGRFVVYDREFLKSYFNTTEMAIYGKPCEDVTETNVGDMISRQAAIDAMFALCDTGETLKENMWRDNPHIDAITDELENLPSVTPEKKKGKWIPFDVPWYQCSECGAVRKNEAFMEYFCPNCGAEMAVDA